jgi:hypothetical protein
MEPLESQVILEQEQLEVLLELLVLLDPARELEGLPRTGITEVPEIQEMQVSQEQMELVQLPVT